MYIQELHEQEESIVTVFQSDHPIQTNAPSTHSTDVCRMSWILEFLLLDQVVQVINFPSRTYSLHSRNV